MLGNMKETNTWIREKNKTKTQLDEVFVFLFLIIAILVLSFSWLGISFEFVALYRGARIIHGRTESRRWLGNSQL